MAAAVAAEMVVLLHLGFLLYAAVGGFLGLWKRTWLWPHLVSICWSVIVTLTTIGCPLTAIEKWLLHASGQPVYADSFTAHYLRGTLYPPEVEIPLWLTMIAVALLSYGLVLTRHRRSAHAPLGPIPE